MPNIIASLRGVTKEYSDGQRVRQVLHKTDLDIMAQQLTMIIGPSGSGKTTLLSILGLITPPTEGAVLIAGQDVTSFPKDELASLRLNSIGFVFQNSNLLAALNVLENILLPKGIHGKAITPADEIKAIELLNKFDLGSLVYAFPKNLSGGEKQRVAIIRALINEPPLLLCDEPTSSLDAVSSKVVLENLSQLASVPHRAVVMITHDPRALSYADRSVEMENGSLLLK